ncbi:MAG: DNA-directed RNA polymerase subunit alpha [Candidatus Magasanikbacteria bacterium RIFCSPLOWO2_01_FULL_43_20b]|uniref:DNA-directed RNA polymerase subunit alpha n=1 Tax=Candidatus Magasanikbacteria bacterium RIFCSPLOWO2_12_FULL_43_12 TaxID=1798692 RepID=A0A1F6MS88_9BACT|nr:MAG: DNA-directed RNA polymerase subunit alpha [Candidatus Magasanikbacteria bacterium RIFCSPHIGHO2_02_FULL_44_13]OGH72553.1 MAG: DNA-directed RNA polymerase subunit alpha [Candidatus Magasanikbacteria bacterium RIFCSPLOWO2_02_FULL_43_22]OGH73620.1 MAG: DNA-directed RNA polymerase subunit alpha [Candidatus Magasanikbacteria bacterium RIFCSPLOWO2_01_FULL_43_20b]OGH74497.1 MAG: DNA-directed RNA polymerase subunit alpha [Candidatus Magasanikbacteria bacterium RIFCSPLOWO2_12_FULL_43_12]
MEKIFLPSSIEFSSTDNLNIGKVVITPCHQGYGTTLGNALRRVLLSSLPGAAVESVKIRGAQHEFSTIEGVLEDIVEIILNLKQMAVRSFSDQPVILKLEKKGKGEVTAADFEKNSDVEIANPDLKIFTITNDKIKIEMEVTVGKGRGYVPVEEKKDVISELGTVLIDSLYTPIRDIGYKVDLTRVGDVTNYEKLTITIETNGTISPKEAVRQAVNVLMDHFALILEASNEDEILSEVVNEELVAVEEENKNEEDEAEVEKDEKSEAKEAKKIKKAKKPAKK